MLKHHPHEWRAAVPRRALAGQLSSQGKAALSSSPWGVFGPALRGIGVAPTTPIKTQAGRLPIVFLHCAGQEKTSKIPETINVDIYGYIKIINSLFETREIRAQCKCLAFVIYVMHICLYFCTYTCFRFMKKRAVTHKTPQTS